MGGIMSLFSPKCRHPPAEEYIGARNLAGRVFVVTGGTAGIGKETVRVLYAAGATVVVASRNRARLDAARAEIEGRESDGEAAEEGVPPRGQIFLVELDLARLSTVRKAVETIRGLELGPIDSLICNAAVADVPFSLTEEGGFESTMAINHLSHFALTLSLLPDISRRIVVVSAHGHSSASAVSTGRVRSFVRGNATKSGYDGLAAYCRSKLANVVFASELDRRLKEIGSRVEAFSLHPGAIITEIGRYSRRAHGILVAYENKTIGQGAATTVFAVLDDELVGQGGAYLSDCRVARASGSGRNARFAGDVFRESEDATQIRFEDVALKRETD